MAEKKNPVVASVAQPNYDAAIRESKDNTRSDYYQRMGSRPMAQPAATPVPTSTVEKSVQNTPDGGNKQVVKTTSPLTQVAPEGPGVVGGVTRGMARMATLPIKQGIQTYEMLSGGYKAPPATIEGGAFGGPFETAEGAGLGAASPASGIIPSIEPAMKAAFTVPGPGAQAQNATATPGIIPTPPPPTLGGGTVARRVGGADQQFVPDTAEQAMAAKERQSGIVPNEGLSRWGITQQDIGGGTMQYTLPGTEGTMTVKPQAAGTYDDEAARQGLFQRMREENALAEQGILNRMDNEAQLRERAIQIQRSTEAEKDLEMQRAAGIVPLSGMAEFDANARRSREISQFGAEGAAKLESDRLAAGKEAYSQYQQGKAAATTAEGKTAAEAAKQNIERQKMGLDVFKAGREARFQDAQIAKWAQEMGNTEYDRQIRTAKNADEAAQINLNFGRQAIDSEFAALEDAAKNLGLTDQVASATQLADIAAKKRARYEDLEWRNPTVGKIKSLPKKDDNGNVIGYTPIQWNGKDWILYQAQGVVQ